MHITHLLSHKMSSLFSPRTHLNMFNGKLDDIITVYHCDLFQRLQSPIHIAAEMGHTDICELLLAAGANIEQKEQVNILSK